MHSVSLLDVSTAVRRSAKVLPDAIIGAIRCSCVVFDSLGRFDQQAFNFATGQKARRAFDLSSESDEIRDLYGRHTWGQSTLLARRLVEAGSSFVTVHLGGWDHHWNLEFGR